MIIGEKIEEVYVVKFDRGYYAKKQPRYEWSYTDELTEANFYKTFDKANERGLWGLGLCTRPCLSYEVQKYVVKTTSIIEKV